MLLQLHARGIYILQILRFLLVQRIGGACCRCRAHPAPPRAYRAEQLAAARPQHARRLQLPAGMARESGAACVRGIQEDSWTSLQLQPTLACCPPQQSSTPAGLSPQRDHDRLPLAARAGQVQAQLAGGQLRFARLQGWRSMEGTRQAFGIRLQGDGVCVVFVQQHQAASHRKQMGGDNTSISPLHCHPDQRTHTRRGGLAGAPDAGSTR